MALRNLAVKMRVSASAAPRLLSAPRVLPASGSRALHLSSSPGCSDSPAKVARDWYMLQRTRYDDVNRELKILRRMVLWTEKLECFFRRFYLVGAPLATGAVFLEWKSYREADAAAREAAGM